MHLKHKKRDGQFKIIQDHDLFVERGYNSGDSQYVELLTLCR